MKKLVLTILFIGAILNKGFCQVSKEEMIYLPRVLFTLSYGTENNQVGILGEGIDVESELGGGPANFVVDFEGNIYICDEMNKKAKKFNNTGRLIFTIEGLGEFTVDKEGNVYAPRPISIDESVVDKYDRQGRFLYTIDYDPYVEIYNANRPPEKRRVPRASSPEIDKIPRFYGPLLLMDSKGREYKVDYILDPTDPQGTRKKETNIKCYSSNGEIIGSFTLFPAKATSSRSPLIRTPSVKAKIPDYKDLKYGLDVEFVDGEGNIYASGLAKRGKPLILWERYSYGCKRRLYITSDIIIYKYDAQGNFITQVRFPFVPTVVSINSYIFDQSGNIYCLQFHKKGMDVVKYEWKAGAKDEKKRE